MQTSVGNPDNGIKFKSSIQVIDTTRSEDSPLAAEESTCARPYNRNRTENRTIMYVKVLGGQLATRRRPGARVAQSADRSESEVSLSAVARAASAQQK